MTRLVDMPPERFAEFVATAGASHAADHVASGRWRADEAHELALSELNRLLPQGFATPGHHFHEITVDAAGPFAARARARGARRVEELARSLGLDTLALNVLGGNLRAQALYRSLGHVVTSLSMRKEL